ncbi:MAG: hypothetical protein SNJ75_15905, partial [Gemmataceae bacterium]
MSRKRTWNIDWMLRNDEARINNPGEAIALRDEQLRDIRKGLGDPKKKGLFRIYYALQPLATWEALVGIVAVMKEQPNAWQHIRLSFLYRAWAVRIAVAEHDSQGDAATGSLQLRDRIIECLAHSMATHEDDFSHWCGGRIVRSFQLGDNAFSHEYGTPYEPFVILLYALWRREVVDLSARISCPLGPYQALLDAWETEEQYLRAILDICEYHCQRCTDSRGNPEPGLCSAPYHMFPADILAVRRVRRDLGLPDPNIKHKLLDTPAAHPPNTPLTIDGSLLGQIAQRVRTDYPGVTH